MVRRPGGADFAPGAYVFPGGTVHDDSEPDVLTGGPGMDWYFADLTADLASRKRDKILGAKPGEVIIQLDS